MRKLFTAGATVIALLPLAGVAQAEPGGHNCVISKFSDGEWCGEETLGVGRTLRITLNSSGGYEVNFIAYDENGKRLGDSGDMHPGQKEATVVTNHTSHTIKVRVYADAAFHTVDVRVKAEYFT